jgi:hypothetical protein
MWLTSANLRACALAVVGRAVDLRVSRSADLSARR